MAEGKVTIELKNGKHKSLYKKQAMIFVDHFGAKIVDLNRKQTKILKPPEIIKPIEIKEEDLEAEKKWVDPNPGKPPEPKKTVELKPAVKKAPAKKSSRKTTKKVIK